MGTSFDFYEDSMNQIEEEEVEEVDPFYCIIGCMTAIKVATIKNKVVFNTGSKSIRTKHVSQRASGGLQSKSTFISLRERVIL